jgi:enoyl-CoA hydratase/carnithine racemase
MGVLTRNIDQVVEITLDWPDIRNALGPVEAAELRQALEAANADGSVAAIVLSANGKAFCAGGNLPEIVRLAAGGKAVVRDTIYREFQGAFRAIRESKVPVIAGVDGAAVGFGCDLAIAGAMTFIGKHGWLAQGWAKLGLVPATGGTLYAIERGGPQAMWRLLTADRVDGPTAEAWGLGIACEDGRAAALAAAARLAALPGEAVRAITHLAGLPEMERHWETALAYQAEFLTSPAFAARAAALLKG